MNLVLTISRRFGTGAGVIAEELSRRLDIPVYDKAYIEHELEDENYADEAEVIRELASHPCIILGRCASEILKGQGNVFNIYVCADKEDRIQRIMKKKDLPYEEARAVLDENDRARADYESALEEMKSRGSEYPGGSCGLWGCCGAAVSAGMFMSIVTKATPLTGKSWGLSNRMTAEALKAIGELGGPRCCKRNSFTAAAAAVKYTAENLGIEMELPEKIQCEFSGENRECLRKRCPYYRDANWI